MIHEEFVQNVQKYSNIIGEKPEAACENSGAGYALWGNIKKGRSPSIDRVSKLAAYFGISVTELIGEPTNCKGEFPLHDSAVVLKPDDFKRLTLDEMDMVLAYRVAAPDDRLIVDTVLRKYKKGTTSEVG